MFTLKFKQNLQRMSIAAHTPNKLLVSSNRINLYHLHVLFQEVAEEVREHTRSRLGFDPPLTAGMWGGSYLVAGPTGESRTNVVRLYSIVNLPQNTPLDETEPLESFMQIYRDTLQSRFGSFGLQLENATWGEVIPYSNRKRPTTAMQLIDTSRRVNFVRAFFVQNTATWAESIIYDMIRNVRQLKELLDINHRPMKRAPDEMKFMLQDVLITYFTLKTALNPDFVEHAEPIIDELFRKFISGLHDPEALEEQYHRVYANMLAYGYEEALEGPYKREGLNIYKLEEWPEDKINYVPRELKEKLVPHLEGTFETFRQNLAARQD